MLRFLVNSRRRVGRRGTVGAALLCLAAGAGTAVFASSASRGNGAFGTPSVGVDPAVSLVEQHLAAMQAAPSDGPDTIGGGPIPAETFAANAGGIVDFRQAGVAPLPAMVITPTNGWGYSVGTGQVEIIAGSVPNSNDGQLIVKTDGYAGQRKPRGAGQFVEHNLGALTITGGSGGVITFTSASGRSGSFSVSTGHFTLS